MIVRQNDGKWWATTDAFLNLWAQGDTETEATDRFLELTGDTPGDMELVHSIQVKGVWYSGYYGPEYANLILSTGMTQADSERAFVAHVPVPQPTEASGFEPPPKLEPTPLPPV